MSSDRQHILGIIARITRFFPRFGMKSTNDGCHLAVKKSDSSAFSARATFN
jgi:hypothetical protein